MINKLISLIKPNQTSRKLHKHSKLIKILIIVATLLLISFSFIIVRHWQQVKTHSKQIITRKKNQQNKLQGLNLIIFQLGEESIQTTSINNGVYFEYNPQVSIKTSWIESDVGILVLRTESDFKVINGFDKNNTPMYPEEVVTLSDIVDKSITEINNKNPIYSHLALWVGSNGDYSSGKLVPLENLHISSFSAKAISQKAIKDTNENYQIAQGTYQFDGENYNRVFQIMLKNDLNDWIYKLKIEQSFEINTSHNDIDDTANINLNNAIALSPQLHQEVINYVGKLNNSNDDLEKIAIEWANTMKTQQTLADKLLNSTDDKLQTNLNELQIDHLRTIEKMTGMLGGMPRVLTPIKAVGIIPKENPPTKVEIDQVQLEKCYQSLLTSIKQILTKFNEFDVNNNYSIKVTIN